MRFIHNPISVPETVLAAMGSEDVDLFAAPPQALMGYSEQLSQQTNRQRVGMWQELTTRAADKGIELTYAPYRKTSIQTGFPLSFADREPADVYVVVSVPGFDWLSKKLAGHAPRPNVWYWPSPPRGASQGSLAGVRSVLLIAPPLESMTAALEALTGTEGRTGEKQGEAQFWSTALTQVLPEVIDLAQPEEEMQAPGLTIRGQKEEQEAIYSPMSGTVMKAEQRARDTELTIIGAADPMPVSIYTLHIPAIRGWQGKLQKMIERVREAEEDGVRGARQQLRGLEESLQAVDELLQDQEARIYRLQSGAESAIRTLEIFSFNARALQHHMGIVAAEKDVLLKIRSQMPPGEKKDRISKAIAQYDRLISSLNAKFMEIPEDLRAEGMRELVRGYKDVVPPITPTGRYEYQPARKTLVRIESFRIPKGFTLAVAEGEQVRAGSVLAAPPSVGSLEYTPGAVPESNSALQTRTVSKKTVVPVTAQVTLFFQPRAVSNEKIIRVISPKLPVPKRMSVDDAFKEVEAEIDQSDELPEWYKAREAAVRRPLTNEEIVGYMKEEAFIRAALNQKIAFVDRLTEWMGPYLESFLPSAVDAASTKSEDADVKMRPEDFSQAYYAAQPAMFPGGGTLEDLTEKGKREALLPMNLAKAREALMRPKPGREPVEPSDEQLVETSLRMFGPRPVLDPIFLYIITFFDAAGAVIWEGKVPLTRIPVPFKTEGTVGQMSAPPDQVLADPNFLRAMPPGMTFNPKERRAIAFYADLTSYVPSPKVRPEVQRAEQIGEVAQKIAALREYGGERDIAAGKLELKYARQVEGEKGAAYRPLAGQAVRGEVPAGRFSYLKAEIPEGGTLSVLAMGEDRLDQYLGYLIPKAMAEKFGMADRKSAVAAALLKMEGEEQRQKEQRAPVTYRSEEDIRQKMSELAGKYALTGAQRKNPVSNRLLSNPRYRQLMEKTGRFMGRPLRNPSEFLEDDEEAEGGPPSDPTALAEYLKEDLAPGAVRVFDAFMADPSKSITASASTERDVQAALNKFKLHPLYAQALTEAQSRPAAPPSESAAPALKRRRRKVESEPVAPAPEPSVEVAAEPRPTRRRRAAAAPAPESRAFVGEEEPSRQGGPRKPASPEEELQAAEEAYATARGNAQAIYEDFYEKLSSPRSKDSDVQAAKSAFEAAYVIAAAALNNRNQIYAQVRGEEALLVDLSRQQRETMQLASAPYARGPDGVNERLSSTNRAALLERLATRLGWDSVPMFDPSRRLMKRGMGVLKLVTPEEAAEIAKASKAVAPISLSPFSYPSLVPASAEAALIAARGQGQMRRVRPKATSTAYLQMEGARGSHNIPPEVYTAPRAVLDRGYDRAAREEKKAVILWVSPESNHIIRYTTGPAPEDAYGKLDAAMVGQFDTGPGESWRDMLDRALTHTVLWYSDIRKGEARQASYDLWLGKSGWPYMYRLYSANDKQPISNALLLDRMQKSGLTVQAGMEELALGAAEASKSAKANTVPWTSVPPSWKGDVGELNPEVMADALSFKNAISRVRKVRPTGAPEVFGTDLLGTFETLAAKRTAGVVESFSSDNALTPILVIPPSIYDGMGRDRTGTNAEQIADAMADIAYTAVREAVGSGLYKVRLVDPNMFAVGPDTPLTALIDAARFETLALASDGEVKTTDSGDFLIPSPLAAMIKFAAMEAKAGSLQRPLTVEVVLPRSVMGAKSALEQLPARIIKKGADGIVQVEVSLTAPEVAEIKTRQGLAQSTAGALTAALSGLAGRIFLADLPVEEPEGKKSSGKGTDYFAFNPALAGDLSRAIMENIGAVTQVRVLTKYTEHVSSMAQLIQESLIKRVMSAQDVPNAEVSIPIGDVKVKSLQGIFSLRPGALAAGLQELGLTAVTPIQIAQAVISAAFANLSNYKTFIGSFIVQASPYERGEQGIIGEEPVLENPRTGVMFRSNYNRRTRIDMASRFMRQRPWAYPDR